MNTSIRSIMLCLMLCAPVAHGNPVWVSDEFEIMLRTGPSTTNAIALMISSGKQLEVLERDAESGYSRVRTAGGTEGWVLTRYLMSEASAREQLEKLTGQLTNANTLGTSLDSKLRAIKSEYDSANRRITTLEREKSAVTQELTELTKTAANVLGIHERNKSLADELSSMQIRADTLQTENHRLSSQATRYWFMSGALTLVVGIILGIWLPRVRWQRRTRYDRF